jgi:hypothetical protein
MKGSLPSSVALLFSLTLLYAGGCAGPSPRPDSPALRAPALVASGAPATAPLDEEDVLRIPRPPREEREDGWAARGLYVGATLVSALPMGDFDGDSALAGMSDLILIPDLDVGAGAGIFVSYRWYVNEFLLQYEATEHDGDFSGSPQEHDTTFYNLDLNWRHYFWPSTAVQPYALLGLGWGRAAIDNGSTDQATGTIFEDAELEDGINVNLGAGLAFYPVPGVALFGEGVYRFVRYESSDGIDGSFSNNGDVDGDGWRLAVGAAIRLLPGHR